MKRAIACFLLLTILLTGCHFRQTNITEPVNFYFPADETGHIGIPKSFVPEVRESVAYIGNTKGLIQLYLSGPESAGFLNPFPRNSILEHMVIDGTSATAYLNSDFFVLKDINLTVACACLTLTISELTGVQSVTITSKTGPGSSKTSITMRPDQLITEDPILN